MTLYFTERPSILQVVGAESHAQMEQDWYMLTVAADLLAFLYVALFYQVSQRLCMMKPSYTAASDIKWAIHH